MLASMAMSSDSGTNDDGQRSTRDESRRRWSTAQIRLVGFIVVLAVVNITYRLIYATGWQQTGALYVGVPTVLAVGLALLPHSKSSTGMILKGSTLAVLIACVVLPEGMLCLLFVMPLIALIAVIVGGALDSARARRHSEGPRLMIITLPLILLSLEGVVGSPFDTHDAASSSVVVDASPDDVARALATTPRFDAELPTFLTIGFNQPVAATGSGIAVGDERMIVFNGGTHDDHPLRIIGGGSGAGHHSHMQLSVVESSAGRVVFAVDADTTMLSRWVDLDRAIVSWEATADGRTRVSWRLEYERLLFPTLYFGPLQRYGMGKAAEFLLHSIVIDALQ